MNYKLRTKHGLTLTEMVVVVSIVAVFTVLGLPAIRAFVRSVESGSSARAMISAALSSGRAIAAREQHYAGVRFQNKYQQDGKGCQYMIFIVHDFDKTGLANGFRAVEGIEPIKLPDSVGVMEVVNGDGDIDDNPSGEVMDKTTFSIIFSPSGKLVIHEVQTRNKDGEATAITSKDDIFNVKSNVENGIGTFVQDNSGVAGLQDEPSRNSFRIYDKTVFEKLNPNSRYNDYLKDLEVVYINPYTGTMINRD
jgi:prepilin-type N-terminal cleavage/methylation domain-containing protein